MEMKILGWELDKKLNFDNYLESNLSCTLW